jgi:hypothetical protein
MAGVNAANSAVITTKQTVAVRITGRTLAKGDSDPQTIKSKLAGDAVPTCPNWQEAPSFFAGCFQLTDLASLLNTTVPGLLEGWSHMRKFGRYVITAVGASVVSLVSLASLGTGIAAADDYSGQTYGDASQAISDAGKKAVIASRAGDTLDDDKCVVTHSQSAPWIKGDDFSPVSDTVLVYLNCNATVASNKDPGNSAGSPEGRAAIQQAQQDQADQAAQSGQ